MRRNQNRRFTLVELLTVMGIIFVMAAMVIGVSTLVSKNMTEAKTKARMEAMVLALQEFQRDRGYFPQLGSAGWVDLSFASDLSDFKHSQTGRPYLEDYAGGVYKDGWDQAFQYTIDPATALGSGSTDKGYWLRSKGRDKAANTEDDICSWKQR